MTLKTSDARLDVYLPGNTSSDPVQADVQITNDLEYLDTDARLQDLVDTGSIRIWNPAATYTDQVRSGARLRFFVQEEGAASLEHKWTGMVRPLTYEEAPVSDGWMGLSVDDYVFGILDTRIVVNSFEDTQISGTSGSILNTILANNAPELDTSLIETVAQTTTVVWNGKTLLEAVKELADQADAAVWGDDDQLGFAPISGLTPSWTLAASDRGPMTVTENDDRLVNELRVVGGEGVAEADTQTTQSAYSTVTDTTRLTYQINTRKSEVPRVEVWTNPASTGSGESVIVRLQADDGAGVPVDVADRQSDIARRELSASFLASNDYTTFLLPDHRLPDPNPHIIIESDGATGQEIGVDGVGDLTFKAYFAYPLDTVAEDEASIDKYGRRERPDRNNALKKRRQVIDYGNAVLRHSKEVEREAAFTADSSRAHALMPGDVITFDDSQVNAVGDFIVTSVRRVYDGSNLETELTFREVDTL